MALFECKIKLDKLKLNKKEMRHIGSITIIEHLNPYRQYLVKETVHLFNCDLILQSTSTPKDKVLLKILPPTQVKELSFGGGGINIMTLGTYASHSLTVGIGKLGQETNACKRHLAA